MQLDAQQMVRGDDSCRQNELLWAGKSWQEIKVETSKQQDAEKIVRKAMCSVKTSPSS